MWSYIGTGKIITFAFHFFHFETFSGKVEKWFFHFSKAKVKVKKVKKSLFHFSGKSLEVKKVKSESEKRKWLFFAFQCMFASNGWFFILVFVKVLTGSVQQFSKSQKVRAIFYVKRLTISQNVSKSSSGVFLKVFWLTLFPDRSPPRTSLDFH